MLLLTTQVRADLERWVRAGYPHETCGLLAGLAQNGLTRVLRAFQARNLAVDRPRDRYELDPADHLTADLEARRQGLAVVGVWHSHPDHPAVPSETDRAAAWEGWSYLILSVAPGGLEAMRSWRLSGEVFQQEEVATMGKAERVLDSGGKLRPFVNVFVGSSDVRTLQGLASPVPEGAVISILPAVAGGRLRP